MLDISLAIETSGRNGSVAVVVGSGVVATESFSHGLKHAAGLLPMIDRLLRDHGGSPASIKQLFVSQGPGSFTGLRIGITLAKTIAYATGAKIVPVPTLQVLAMNADRIPGNLAKNVIIVLDAKRDQIFTARYEKSQIEAAAGESIEDWNQGWAEREPPHLDSLSAMLQRSPRPVYLLGEGLPFHEKFLPSDRNGIELTDDTYWTAEAATVAKIGLKLAAANKFADVDSFVPLYIRQPEAEEKYDQLHPREN